MKLGLQYMMTPAELVARNKFEQMRIIHEKSARTGVQTEYLLSPEVYKSFIAGESFSDESTQPIITPDVVLPVFGYNILIPNLKKRKNNAIIYYASHKPRINDSLYGCEFAQTTIPLSLFVDEGVFVPNFESFHVKQSQTIKDKAGAFVTGEVVTPVIALQKGKFRKVMQFETVETMPEHMGLPAPVELKYPNFQASEISVKDKKGELLDLLTLQSALVCRSGLYGLWVDKWERPRVWTSLPALTKLPKNIGLYCGVGYKIKAPKNIELIEADEDFTVTPRRPKLDTIDFLRALTWKSFITMPVYEL